ncbi:hypothetical protein L4D76_18720 [Photobacterium sagamiensis]|uniref:hypothetical protein n=1 Tax=Photobacterium sagamiensis TaxID=2910241 RepID=UPI003D09CA8F
MSDSAWLLHSSLLLRVMPDLHGDELRAVFVAIFCGVDADNPAWSNGEKSLLHGPVFRKVIIARHGIIRPAVVANNNN